MLQYTDKHGNYYCVMKYRDALNASDIIAIQINNDFTRYYKVVPDKNREYTYRIQKTQIKAADGIEGLYKHFQECIESDFAINAWMIEPLKRIVNTVKQVKYNSTFRIVYDNE